MMAETGSELDDGLESAAPVWAVFGDLMAGALGAFALILVAALGMQMELADRLKIEQQQRAEQARRLMTLEQALAGPLAAGRVTLQDGRIGISGSVLFAFNSDELQPEAGICCAACRRRWRPICASAARSSWSAASPTTAPCAAAARALPTTGSCRPSAL